MYEETEQQLTVEQAEQLKKDHMEKVALQDALIKLEKNSAFKKLIVGYYFNDHALSMVPLVGHSNENAANNAHNNLVGIGALQAFLNAVHAQGNQSRREIKEIEAALYGSVEE